MQLQPGGTLLLWPLTHARSFLRRKAEKKAIRPLFDGHWYLDRYRDLRDAKLDPLDHFLTWGARERRDPHPLFWTGYYLAQCPDIEDACRNPLAHYLRSNWCEGRDPNPLFDSDWYLRRNPDVAKTGTNPLLHYIERGAAEGRDPHPFFDTAWYLKQHPDLVAARSNPLAHFLSFGARESCNPTSVFHAPKRPDASPELFDTFQNVGDSCEFGMVQGFFASNQLGLFRYAATPIDSLIAALRDRFRALTSPSAIDMSISFDGAEQGRRQYLIGLNAYGVLCHSGITEPFDIDELKTIQTGRVRLLVRKFIEDLEEGEKIFVYRSNLRTTRDKVEELLSVMRTYGPVTLLWVTLETDTHPAGSVEVVSEGLLRGYIDGFAPYEDATQYSAEIWKTICFNARDLWLEKRSRS